MEPFRAFALRVLSRLALALGEFFPDAFTYGHQRARGRAGLSPKALLARSLPRTVSSPFISVLLDSFGSYLATSWSRNLHDLKFLKGLAGTLESAHRVWVVRMFMAIQHLTKLSLLLGGALMGNELESCQDNLGLYSSMS